MIALAVIGGFVLIAALTAVCNRYAKKPRPMSPRERWGPQHVKHHRRESRSRQCDHLP